MLARVTLARPRRLADSGTSRRTFLARLTAQPCQVGTRTPALADVPNRARLTEPRSDRVAVPSRHAHDRVAVPSRHAQDRALTT